MSAREPDLPSGVPLRDAYQRWSDPADLQRLSTLPSCPPRFWAPQEIGNIGWGQDLEWLGFPTRPPPRPDNALWREREQIQARLDGAILNKVRKGELIATGFEAPLRADSRRAIIPHQLWEVLRLSFR